MSIDEKAKVYALRMARAAGFMIHLDDEDQSAYVGRVIEAYEAAKAPANSPEIPDSSPSIDQPVAKDGDRYHDTSSYPATVYIRENGQWVKENAATTEQPVDCSKEFEAWARTWPESERTNMLERRMDGEYPVDKTRYRWEGFQKSWQPEREAVTQPASTEAIWNAINDELKEFALGGEFSRNAIANQIFDRLSGSFEIRRRGRDD